MISEDEAPRDRRAWEIAMNALRLALLTRRPEFLLDRRTRAEHALADDVPPGALHLLDAAMVIGAAEPAEQL